MIRLAKPLGKTPFRLDNHWLPSARDCLELISLVKTLATIVAPAISPSGRLFTILLAIPTTNPTTCEHKFASMSTMLTLTVGAAARCSFFVLQRTPCLLFGTLLPPDSERLADPGPDSAAAQNATITCNGPRFTPGLAGLPR